MLVRGFYYEGWHPGDKPPKERKEAFLAHVAGAFRQDLGVNPEEAARAVFRVLAGRVTAGEIAGIKHGLPHELRTLWP
jgi:uncharacterized protein (DUF2267 family)